MGMELSLLNYRIVKQTMWGVARGPSNYQNGDKSARIAPEGDKKC